jgi:hypothetical protein
LWSRHGFIAVLVLGCLTPGHVEPQLGRKLACEHRPSAAVNEVNDIEERRLVANVNLANSPGRRADQRAAVYVPREVYGNQDSRNRFPVNTETSWTVVKK